MDLADDDERHHATRDDFLHLSDLEWNVIQRMAETIDHPAVGAMLLSLSRYEQHATIAKFIQHELDENKINYLATDTTLSTGRPVERARRSTS